MDVTSAANQQQQLEQQPKLFSSVAAMAVQEDPQRHDLPCGAQMSQNERPPRQTCELEEPACDEEEPLFLDASEELRLEGLAEKGMLAALLEEAVAAAMVAVAKEMVAAPPVAVTSIQDSAECLLGAHPISAEEGAAEPGKDSVTECLVEALPNSAAEVESESAAGPGKEVAEAVDCTPGDQQVIEMERVAETEEEASTTVASGDSDPGDRAWLAIPSPDAASSEAEAQSADEHCSEEEEQGCSSDCEGTVCSHWSGSPCTGSTGGYVDFCMPPASCPLQPATAASEPILLEALKQERSTDTVAKYDSAEQEDPGYDSELLRSDSQLLHVCEGSHSPRQQEHAVEVKVRSCEECDKLRQQLAQAKESAKDVRRAVSQRLKRECQQLHSQLREQERRTRQFEAEAEQVQAQLVPALQQECERLQENERQLTLDVAYLRDELASSKLAECEARTDANDSHIGYQRAQKDNQLLRDQLTQAVQGEREAWKDLEECVAKSKQLESANLQLRRQVASAKRAEEEAWKAADLERQKSEQLQAECDMLRAAASSAGMLDAEAGVRTGGGSCIIAGGDCDEAFAQDHTHFVGEAHEDEAPSQKREHSREPSAAYTVQAPRQLHVTQPHSATHMEPSPPPAPLTATQLPLTATQLPSTGSQPQHQDLQQTRLPQQCQPPPPSLAAQLVSQQALSARTSRGSHAPGTCHVISAAPKAVSAPHMKSCSRIPVPVAVESIGASAVASAPPAGQKGQPPITISTTPAAPGTTPTAPVATPTASLATVASAAVVAAAAAVASGCSSNPATARGVGPMLPVPATAPYMSPPMPSYSCPRGVSPGNVSPGGVSANHTASLTSIRHATSPSPRYSVPVRGTQIRSLSPTDRAIRSTSPVPRSAGAPPPPIGASVALPCPASAPGPVGGVAVQAPPPQQPPSVGVVPPLPHAGATSPRRGLGPDAWVARSKAATPAAAVSGNPPSIRASPLLTGRGSIARTTSRTAPAASLPGSASFAPPPQAAPLPVAPGAAVAAAGAASARQSYPWPAKQRGEAQA